MIKRILMKLKERGMTVGDLLIIVFFIISTVFIINKIKEGEKNSYFYMINNEILTSINL